MLINKWDYSLIEDTIGWRHTFIFFAALVMVFCVILPGLFLKNRPGYLGQIPDGPRSKKADTSKKKIDKKAICRTPVDFTAKEAFKTKALWMLLSFYTLQYMTMNWVVTHQVSVVVMAIAFVCIIFAKSPVHPSLKRKGIPLKREAFNTQHRQY